MAVNHKLELVPVTPLHADFFYKLREDPETLMFNPVVPATLATVREMLLETSSDFRDFEKVEKFRWFVELEGQLVANVGITNINRMMLFAEVSYGVDAEYRAQGIATSSLNLLIKKVFDETPLRKLIAYVHEKNEASRKVIERSGFKQEGLLREQYLLRGKPVNEYIYGILRHEFVSK